MTSTYRNFDQAEVVIVGGGVIGCSIAYHLCREGVSDVLVLERNELASGATARSAGCLSHGRSDASTIRMIVRTRAAIRELEEQLRESLEFHQVGCIRAALSDEREAELRHVEDCVTGQGLALHVLSAAEARDRCPWLHLESARRVVYLPDDGYIDGARLGLAYARAARAMGARVGRGIAVTGVLHEDGRVTGVDTNAGTVRSRWVIDAAGAWGVEVASWASWGLAAAPTRSHYWITAPDGAGAPDQPNVQLPDMRAYVRSEVGGLLVGLREPRSHTFDPMTLEHDMSDMRLTEEQRDLDLLVEQAGALRAVAPDIDRWGFAHHIAGLSMYTPDGRFIVGPVPGVEGFLIAGGCCGSGVAASGGFGQTVAQLVAGREPAIDIGLYRPDRFGRVDPASQGFRDRCAAARAGKSMGNMDA
jgi:4-methylaminobutanoate oxidase (formaldehyde-forming)